MSVLLPKDQLDQASPTFKDLDTEIGKQPVKVSGDCSVLLLLIQSSKG